MKKYKNAVVASLFFSFMFIQYAVLRLGNQAGRGYLSDERQQYVYLFIQLFVICGFLSYALVKRLVKNAAADKVTVLAVLGILVAGTSVMFCYPPGSAVYLAVTFAAVACLGFTGGAVYHRMSESTLYGAKTGICAGIGCSAALTLQYFLQLKFTLAAPLSIALISAFSFIAYYFLFAVDGRAVRSEDEETRKPSRLLLFAVIITFAMLLFSGYYNMYIHRLQIASGYSEYNVYTWPRLCQIPGFLLLGAAADIKKGKYLPISALCVVVIALLNASLIGQGGAYDLNMCLFYISISAVVSYYNLTFFRYAAKSKRPALWASSGRVLDSVSVLFFGFLSLDSLNTAAVLALDIAALAVILVLMALNGDLNLVSKPVPAPAADELQGDPETAFDLIKDRYGLTPGETKVLRELVLTEDKQIAIGERLSIKIRTVQANVTSIYRKTGISTRSGLVQLYNDVSRS